MKYILVLLLTIPFILLGCAKDATASSTSGDEAPVSSTAPAGSVAQTGGGGGNGAAAPTPMLGPSPLAAPASAPKGDPKAKTESPVGTWKLPLGKLEGKHQKLNPDMYKLHTVELKADGTFVSKDADYTGSGTWSVQGNVFSIVPEGGGPPVMTLSADGKKITLYLWWGIPPATMVFKRA